MRLFCYFVELLDFVQSYIIKFSFSMHFFPTLCQKQGFNFLVSKGYLYSSPEINFR